MMGNLVCALFHLLNRYCIYCLHHTEELLIDFHKLIGEHSGENMAEAVWQTLELYGLISRVRFPFAAHHVFANIFQIIAIVMDNASNNNTLMTSLES
jgi:hypothetical protein